jgi:hypothetical protein
MRTVAVLEGVNTLCPECGKRRTFRSPRSAVRLWPFKYFTASMLLEAWTAEMRWCSQNAQASGSSCPLQALLVFALSGAASAGTWSKSAISGHLQERRYSCGCQGRSGISLPTIDAHSTTVGGVDGCHLPALLLAAHLDGVDPRATRVNDIGYSAPKTIAKSSQD